MKSPDLLPILAARAEATFKRHKVKLTLGGEPTYVPLEPTGPEWSFTALGPTKLRYAYELADALIKQCLPQAVTFYSPGKLYPGEPNPRWTIFLLWRQDGQPLLTAKTNPRDHLQTAIESFKSFLLKSLKLKTGWLKAKDPLQEGRCAWVLPLDHDGKKFRSADWKMGSSLELLAAEGPAGLRLPLADLPPEISRRALTLEWKEEQLHVFVPPLLQGPFLALLESIAAAALRAKTALPIHSGYIPSDEAKLWGKLGITADPGVLEINLPPCPTWQDYESWLHKLETAGATAGLRSFKQINEEEQAGSGGGNHLLFGGPSLETNPLFTHPRWITSILRYWQHHPSLAYLFTGPYVGASSQAPRPDESANALYDLEMAYQFLEQLPRGDHRQLISATLHHLHTDSSGNTHRSEISFDKFWNLAFDGGARGLIEFRAVESLPKAHWMSAVALLWWSLAAALLEKPFSRPLIDHGDHLHDRFFLPSHLWIDFKLVLRDLRKAGFELPESLFAELLAWRFPIMLNHRKQGANLKIRKALEGWPLLCETPLEGGSTSRFVDTSIERLEFLANDQFAQSAKIFVNGRNLELQPFPGGKFGIGLRYRRSALVPSLHPGILPQLPLFVEIRHGRQTECFQLNAGFRSFSPATDTPPPLGKPCKKLHPQLLTCDLRLP